MAHPYPQQQYRPQSAYEQLYPQQPHQEFLRQPPQPSALGLTPIATPQPYGGYQPPQQSPVYPRAPPSPARSYISAAPSATSYVPSAGPSRRSPSPPLPSHYDPRPQSFSPPPQNMHPNPYPPSPHFPSSASNYPTETSYTYPSTPQPRPQLNRGATFPPGPQYDLPSQAPYQLSTSPRPQPQQHDVRYQSRSPGPQVLNGYAGQYAGHLQAQSFSPPGSYPATAPYGGSPFPSPPEQSVPSFASSPNYPVPQTFPSSPSFPQGPSALGLGPAFSNGYQEPPPPQMNYQMQQQAQQQQQQQQQQQLYQQQQYQQQQQQPRLRPASSFDHSFQQNPSVPPMHRPSSSYSNSSYSNTLQNATAYASHPGANGMQTLSLPPAKGPPATPAATPPMLYTTLRPTVCCHSVQFIVPLLDKNKDVWRAVNKKIEDYMIRNRISVQHSIIDCVKAGSNRSILTIHVLPCWNSDLNSGILEIVRSVVG